MTAHPELCDMDELCHQCWSSDRGRQVYEVQLQHRVTRQVDLAAAKSIEAQQIATRAVNDRRKLLNAVLAALDLIERDRLENAVRMLMEAAKCGS